MPNSYHGVGGTRFSDAWGTQKTPIFGGHFKVKSPILGVDIILGGGGGGGWGDGFDRFLSEMKYLLRTVLFGKS